MFLLHVAGKLGELEHVQLLLLWKSLRESVQGWSLDVASVSRREVPLGIQVGCCRRGEWMRMLVLTWVRLRHVRLLLVTLRLRWGEKNGQGVGILVAASVIRVVLGEGWMVVSTVVLAGEKIVADLQRSETSTRGFYHLDVG